MKRLGRVGFVLSALLCLSASPYSATGTSSSGRSDSDKNLAGYGYTVAEFMADSEIASALPLLKSRGVGLALPFPSSDLLSPARFAFVKQATALGVEIRPWLLLPDADGYWPNSTNAAQYVRHARQLVDAWLAAGLAPTTFVVDMEMSVQRALRFAELAATLDTQALVRFLELGIDRAEYAAATDIYRSFVQYAHSRGFRVQVTTLAQVIDDYSDGDDGLRQALNIPIDGIPWDEVNIQVYRTLNTLVLEAVAGSTSSGFVYEYAKQTRAVFGERAGVSIGCTDPGDLSPTAPSYKNGKQLREDVDAAASAGIVRSQIVVYGLRGIVRRPPLQQWFLPRSASSFPPFPDLPTFITHASSAVLDAQL
ncbi:MAG: hypothetical protein JWN48_3468 [Myxococcaceae bacterium]|nr:hypothetical protein [Myxococcaceae bacterium]